jgi:Xaa-Pro aminopeptidase
VTGLAARSARELPRVLDSLARLGLPVAVVGDVGAGGDTRSRDEQRIDALRQAHPGLRVAAANGAVDALRGRKGAPELALLRRAAQITVRAHREAMRLVEPGLNEFEAQALVEYTFRRNGADRPGFASIVGSGPNATALHYNANDRVMESGDLVVLDIGASYGGYTADVTRTLPVSGRFTPDQRAVYQIVRDAQAAAERAAVVGTRWATVSEAARATIAAGLARLRLIEAADATYDCAAGRECPQWQLYYMHGLGTGSGSRCTTRSRRSRSGGSRRGSAFTLERASTSATGCSTRCPDTPRQPPRARRGRRGGAPPRERRRPDRGRLRGGPTAAWSGSAAPRARRTRWSGDARRVPGAAPRDRAGGGVPRPD